MNIHAVAITDLTGKDEGQLVFIAEVHEDDAVANEAMRLLKEKFDATYGWCMLCDGLVVKESNCCLNIE